jgi:hypothetical protein
MSLVYINILCLVYTMIVHAGMVQKKEESHILCSRNIQLTLIVMLPGMNLTMNSKIIM